MFLDFIIHEKENLIMSSRKVQTWGADIFNSLQGNILEDETAIEILSSSKILSEEISEKQLVATKTEAAIDDVRNGYKPVSLNWKVLVAYGDNEGLNSRNKWYDFPKLYHCIINYFFRLQSMVVCCSLWYLTWPTSTPCTSIPWPGLSTSISRYSVLYYSNFMTCIYTCFRFQHNEAFL